jgi:hypothetical protein
MSSTTVCFRDREYEANDLGLELWELEVVHHIDREQVIDPWLKELRDEWHLQATAGFGFGPTPQLDRFVTTDIQRHMLVKLFVKALDSLAKRSDHYSAEELQRSGAGGPNTYYSEAFPTQSVIEVGQQCLYLLS